MSLDLRLLVISSPDPAIKSLELCEGVSVAGREPGRELYLPSSKVSRKHCSFEVSGGEVVVRDLGSSNGVVVEGQKIREAILAIGQRIQIGDYLMQLVDSSSDQQPEAPQTQPQPVDDLFGGVDTSSSGDGKAQPLFGGFGVDSGSPMFGEDDGSADPPPFDELFGEQKADEAPPPFGMQSQPQKPDHQPQVSQHPSERAQPLSGTSTQISSSQMGDFLSGIGGDKVRELTSRVPWSVRLGGLFLVAFLSTLLLPMGGVKNLLSSVDTGMEGLARSYAVELTSTIARVNGEALSKLDATSIASGSIGGADRAKGVIAGEVFLLDSRGRIKPTSDRPNPRPRLVLRSTETEDVAFETDPETGLFYVVAPIRISVGNAPKQLRGFVYLGFSVDDFLEDTGRANDLFYSALLLMFLVFSVLFWSVRRHANLPILAAADESELAMKGHIARVTLPGAWPELASLLHSVNRAIGRSSSGGGNNIKVDIDNNAISESLVNSCSWPIIVTDGDLKVTLINEIAVRIFHLKPSTRIGSHISRIITKEPLSSAVLGALRTIETGGHDSITQTVNVDGSQRRVTVSSKLAPKSNNSGPDKKVFEFVVVVIA